MPIQVLSKFSLPEPTRRSYLFGIRWHCHWYSVRPVLETPPFFETLTFSTHQLAKVISIFVQSLRKYESMLRDFLRILQLISLLQCSIMCEKLQNGKNIHS